MISSQYYSQVTYLNIAYSALRVPHDKLP